MKMTPRIAQWLALSTMSCQLLTAQAQSMVFTYQGRVLDSGTNFSGAGQFKFALVTSTNLNQQATVTANAPSSGYITGYTVTSGGSGYTSPPSVTVWGGGGSGAAATAVISSGVVVAVNVSNSGDGNYTNAPTVTIAPPPANLANASFWSNDGTSVNGSQPSVAVSVPVTDGLFCVSLGDTNLANMGALAPALFLQPNLQLRIWFNDGINGFAALDPAQTLTPTPYAAFANTASNLSGTLSAAQLSGGLTIQQNASGAPNLIGGAAVNFVAGDVVGATIAGGGATNFGGASYTNSVSATFGTISGGAVNMIQPNADAATIGGGDYNTIQTNAHESTIGGGYQNTIQVGAYDATIGGGLQNSIQTYAPYSTIGGGSFNTIQPIAGGSTISGGFQNSIQQSAVYSAIGGGRYNSIQTNVYDSTIGGGFGNTIQPKASEATIGGGEGNTIETYAPEATIGGGRLNTIQTIASDSTIGGGFGNTIQHNAQVSTIGGGNQNSIQTNAKFSTIAGGSENTIQTNADRSTISGGMNNTIQTNAYNSTIGGGSFNTIQTNASNSTIGGGEDNTIAPYTGFSTIGGGWGNTASGVAATVVGGLRNTASGPGAFVGGGGGYNGISYITNLASGPASVVCGGTQNTASSNYTTVGGGSDNTATNWYATIPGGAWNLAGGQGSFAAGQAAQAIHDGSFVWNCDATTISSTATNQFIARATGGFVFITSGTTEGATLAAGSGSWTSLSDRNAKDHFAAVNPSEVLAKVVALPLSTWNYKSQDDSIRHIGPMAQDFKAAFAMGETDTGISTVDADGVALAAIQGLNQKLAETRAENAELRARLERLEQLISGENGGGH